MLEKDKLEKIQEGSFLGKEFVNDVLDKVKSKNRKK